MIITKFEEKMKEFICCNTTSAYEMLNRTSFGTGTEFLDYLEYIMKDETLQEHRTMFMPIYAACYKLIKKYHEADEDEILKNFKPKLD
jgi:hypothetical protein